MLCFCICLALSSCNYRTTAVKSLECAWIVIVFVQDSYFLLSWDPPSARSALDVQTLASRNTAIRGGAKLLFKDPRGPRAPVSTAADERPARAGSGRPSKHTFVFSPPLYLLSGGFRRPCPASRWIWSNRSLITSTLLLQKNIKRNGHL